MPLFVGASESYDTDAWEAYNLKKENAKLRDENARLRKRLQKVWHAARLLQANGQIEGMRITDEFRAECEADFAELGVEVEHE